METLPDRLVEADPVTSPVREMVLLADNFSALEAAPPAEAEPA